MKYLTVPDNKKGIKNHTVTEKMAELQENIVEMLCTVSKNIFLKCCHQSCDTWNAILITGQTQLTVSLIINLSGGE
jgi:hypothetical protein